MGNLGRCSELLQRKRSVSARSAGNPKGEDQPNKKYYDPRVWLRAGQTSMIARLEKAFKELNAIDVL
ncbi:fructose 1,6-bisphosphate aldolase [Salmonella enterica subsp. enterica]|uniref:Fructose 1,6-bisphosphate aldolase n=1 Tax=Salmonella enterica I TaxID=59201 RepID=A0A379UVT9_SALET|nr:fructose 1,6-bisphosphate aldolase [Salmonella enterica subsp. enterica]